MNTEMKIWPVIIILQLDFGPIKKLITTVTFLKHFPLKNIFFEDTSISAFHRKYLKDIII